MSEFKFPASLSTDPGGVSVVTAFNADATEPIYTANEFHPRYEEILSGLRAGDPDIWEKFDILDGIMSRFKVITERVSWNGSEILWDGDPINSALSEQLERAVRDGNPENYTALAKFWEKLESNPNEHSKEQAYSFLATHSFQITLDGDVVGYKGMSRGEDGTWLSTASSRVAGAPSAYVNGTPLPPLQKVVQRVGDVVSMPRSEVVHDPAQSCSRGLHVSTRSYAKSYGTVAEIHFNPRDIVSVPNDALGEKVRVSRYLFKRVIGENEVLSDKPVISDTTATVGWAGDVGYKVE